MPTGISRTSSFAKAGKMIRTIALGALIGNGSDSVTSTDSNSNTMTFVSGLTDDQRDDDIRSDSEQHQNHNQLGIMATNAAASSSKDDPQEREGEDENRQRVSFSPQLQQHQTSSSKRFDPSRRLAPLVPVLDPVPKLLLEELLSNNGKIVEDAVDRLARKCRKSPEIRYEAYRVGGHAAVVIAMRQWRSNETIQAGGCRCITNMTCQLPAAKRSFAMIGGVESVVVAMKLYPESLQVQCYGCGALMNMLCATKEDTEEISLAMAERFVNNLEGVAIVVESMKRFPKDAKIQLGGCGLFQNLAQNKMFIYSMMQAGAVAAVGASLENHPGDPNIRAAAGSFMKKVFA